MPGALGSPNPEQGVFPVQRLCRLWQGACVRPAGNGREIVAESSYPLIVFDPMANGVISKGESLEVCLPLVVATRSMAFYHLCLPRLGCRRWHQIGTGINFWEGKHTS